MSVRVERGMWGGRTSLDLVEGDGARNAKRGVREMRAEVAREMKQGSAVFWGLRWTCRVVGGDWRCDGALSEVRIGVEGMDVGKGKGVLVWPVVVNRGGRMRVSARHGG